MPCYQVVLVSVEFKVESAKRLKNALEKLEYGVNIYSNWINVYRPGINFDIDIKNNKIQFQKGNWEADKRINEIKRKYSEVTLEEVAKKKKWLLKNKGENKFAFIKY